ncbi:amino acid adenylation domain-containing protein [Bacillus atrophaeus]|nr:non-ribosomal peptide synthetase [Bacillus atrophaeus]MCY8910324.1 amino acid adenylation domain-containing protein [Bacillus atrophaeus]MEC0835921.1 amino acid adenylation domain-containing protein [Bacillus atrophaeus]MEC0847029.1 amino acid adenylation domain-containing protein [Bacillus atrophaeus]MEC0848344.1 amino acid adenylation domain-containing protein [Bacillus atrophaeus]MEC0864803.1 amino acid adenylation domain-containing protein [Bacillus atrophaeus]
MNTVDILKKYKQGKISTTELRTKLQELKNQSFEKKPLSEGQKGLWVLEKLSPGMSAYNVPICFRIRESLDIETFKRAFHFALDRYPILKTIISEEKGIPYQTIQQTQQLYFEREDVSHLENEEIFSHIKKIAREPFSLQKGPLIRVYIFEGLNEQIVLINVHHIIFDGSSVGILLTTLLDGYLDLKSGKDLISDSSPTTFNDFVDWEHHMLSSKRGEKLRDYWKEQLSGSLPILDFPSDGLPRSLQAFKGETHRVSVPSELKDKITSFSKLQRVSLPNFFLGILKVLLYQYSNQDDIIVGMANSGRPGKQFDSLIGYFINMVPIRTQIDDTKNFTQFIKELQLSMIDGLDHADYPFPVMVRELNLPRTNMNSPVFKVGYFYQSFIEANSFSNLTHYRNALQIELLEDIHQEGEYELALEVFEHEDTFMLNLKYNPDLYHASTISRITENLIRLTEEIIENPEWALQKYSLMSANDEKTLLIDWNATERIYAKDKCVQELFEEQVRKTPEAIAVTFENQSLTYRELDEMSTKLAIYIQKQGVTPNTLVGISVERSLHMMVGLLGILKSGGAYVPLDPDYPTERLAYMIQDSKVSIVLSQSKLMTKLNQLLGDNVSCIPLDTSWAEIVQGVKEHDVLKREVGSDNLAYVIYTSGSTGNPKGVMIQHSALTNFLLAMGDEPGITSEDKLLSVTTYCFDIAGLELYLPLIKGAECYICSNETQKNIQNLKEIIKRIKPTIMQATPVTWKALFLIGWRNEEKMKILCGGEALPEGLKQYFTETESEVWNMFGPTETTIWSTTKLIKANEPITIGKPIANTQIYILNKHMKPVPIGVPGELYIGGDGLAKGYLNLPNLTQERFIDNPFHSGKKLYRTGDSARWLATGDIDFLGRIDNQVKIHGFRIELNEIETKLNMHPDIQESAVVIIDHKGNQQIRAFYVRKNNSKTINKLGPKELRGYLKKRLPTYMIPNVLTELNSIPLTPNGKVNRLELSKVNITQPNKKNNSLTESETEKIILEIWKDVIGIDEIDIKDGFFDVGGDSFTAVTVAERISEKLDCDIQVTTIFEHSNIRDISKYIAELKNVNVLHDEEQDTRQGFMENSGENQEKDHKSTSYPEYYEDSIAIIGISCQFPEANTYNEFWQNLREGKESVRILSKEELEELNVPEEIRDNTKYVPVQSTIEGKDLFDPKFFKISPKDAEAMDPQMKLLLLNSWKAVEDAGYISKEIPNTAVYMSSSNNFYQAPNESTDVNIIEDSDGYVSWLLGQGGTIPTMISYQLGLKGPSYSVHSNCSSSLVGLYSAYQSLQSGEADYALVGASTIHSLPSAGYVHVPGLNFSSDGHVKAFDNAADGMIGGEGVAVVVVKKAVNAIKDGDNIYALLRGININNDGTDKVGFYAPSIKGQAEVIQKVLESTKIDPETISYVEAHGTGTKLGDPIEITALSNIYKKYTMKKQYCGIGSVKTNIGHLDTTAGLAGCIKVALGLYNKQLPPTLNFNDANASIDFNQSPFYVVDELKELEDQPIPHRVALSSFGIGGTNVHAIFEMYEETKKTTESMNHSLYLVPLSAKNDRTLKKYATDLLRFLKDDQNRKTSIKNIAYTLQVGREVMDSRVIFLVKDKEDLIQKLEAYMEGHVEIEHCFENKASQASGEIELLEKDEDSHDLIRKWISKGKLEKIAMLWVKGLRLNWQMLYENIEKPRRISLPTYPFAKERFWKSVPSRKEIALVKEKDSVEKLHILIDSNTSDFMELKYTTTLSGEEYFLVDHVINNQKVLPGVVYIEMGRAAGEITTKQKIRKVKNIVWTRPIMVDQHRDVDIVLHPLEKEIEFKVRTVENEQFVIHSQGKLEYLNESTKNDELLNLNKTIDIEACIGRCNGHISHTEFYESDAATVYQYGPTFRPIKEMYFNDSEVISRIEVPLERGSDFYKYTLHPSLLEGCLQTIVGLLKSREPFMPFSIDEIEMVNNNIPKQCYVYATLADRDSEKGNAKKFNLKLLSPEGQLLVDIKSYSIRTITNNLEPVSPKPEKLETVYYHSSWEKANMKEFSGDTIDTLLIFDDGLQTRDTWNMDSQINQMIFVKPGERFKDCHQNIYEINPRRQADYQKLLADLKKKKMFPNKILHMWSQHNNEMNEMMQKGFYSIFYLTKSLLEKAPHERVKLLVTYRDEANISSALGGAISGFAKSVQLEHPKMSFKIVQLPAVLTQLNHILLSELEDEDAEEIRYTDEGRFIKRIKENDMEKETANKPLPFRNNGVYLITGGMGELGLIVAKYLARTLQAKLVLVGRSYLDDVKKGVITELESFGSEVLYLKADVSKREDVDRIFEQTRSRFHTLQGIIHCAGMIQDNLVINKSIEEIHSVVSPKVNGTMHLDEASSKESLDFFMLFSSISHLGNAGQSDYAFANSFLNYFAEYRESLFRRNKRFGKTISINWPIWEEGGMRMSEEALKLLKTIRGIHPLSNEIGLHAIEKLLLQKHSEIIVYHGESSKIRSNNEPKKIQAQPKSTTTKQPIQVIDNKIIFENVKNFLSETASVLLKIQEIDIDQDIAQYGFNSISNTEFSNKINDQYHLDIMPTVLFELEQPTIRSFSQYLCEKYDKELSSFYGKDITNMVHPPKSEKIVTDNQNTTYRSDEDEVVININEGYQTSSRFSYSEQKKAKLTEERVEEPIAIIGMSGIFPQSENLDEFWKNLEEEKNLVTEIPRDRFHWEAFDDPRVKWGGFMKEVDKFDAAFFGISSREAEVMDPQHRLFLQVAWSSIEDAGYKPTDLSGSNTGIFVGIGTQDYSQIIEKHLKENNPYALTGRTPFMLVNRISSMLNLHGPSEPIDTACSSSLVAVHKAVEAIQRGSCNMAIAGGVNAILTPSIHLAFSAAGMLSDNGQCKVFDSHANGTVRSEGVGAILLKRMSDAIADGDHIYGLIKSTAENHKGKSASLTAPNAKAQADLLVDVYRKAKIDPTTISYIETHSTGTKLGDPIEINGLKTAFSELYRENGISSITPHCAIGSLKTNIGHMEAAAGIGAVIKVLLSIKNKKLLSTLHFNELNPYIDLKNSPFYINQNIQPWNRIENDIPRRAGISAFGFGGVNAHIMIEEYIKEDKVRPRITVKPENPVVIVLSAKKRERLIEQAKLLLHAVEGQQFNQEALPKIAYTLQVGREPLEERLAFTAETIDELKEKLLEAIHENNNFSNRIYRGQVKKGNDVVELLSNDEAMDYLIEGWINKGEYNKLISLWVKGMSIDWGRLYNSNKPERLSLPTYPFEKKRYWISIPDKTLADEGEVQSQQSVNKEKVVRRGSNKSLPESQARNSAKDIIHAIFSSLLSIDASEIDDNQSLTELGVDSIILTQLLQQLQLIDPSIDFETLFNCKTMDEIIGVISLSEDKHTAEGGEYLSDTPHEVSVNAEKIYDDQHDLTSSSQNKPVILEKPKIIESSNMVLSDYPELIRLNKNYNDRPVFWFHGGFGGVEVYRLIAQKIKRPFYGIQSRGYMTDFEPIQGIEAMAKYYVKIIQSIQPEGPYDFGGLSLGGMIAYEVTRQMQEIGQSVNSIIMLESIYVDEKMKNDWLTIPRLNLTKDRMLRAINLLLAFSSTEELILISESEITLDNTDEEFLEQLINLAEIKGSTKSANQLRKSINQLEKILDALDTSTTFYDALPLADPSAVKSYYFCNPVGSLFGEDESYFRLVDKGRVYDYLEFSEKWKGKLPTITTLKVNSSNHLTILTEPKSQETIIKFCEKLYYDEEMSDEYINSLSIE